MRRYLSVAAATALCLGGILAAGPASADPACASGCTITIGPGAPTTFLVPVLATSVQITVAAGSGGAFLSNDDSEPAPGGTVVVELGTAFNGDTLHLVAGIAGYSGSSVPLNHGGGGGGGSFVANTSGFLIVAGGGGGANLHGEGGAGGFATASPDGTNSTPMVSVSGTGAVGIVPGTTTGVSSGTVSTVAPDGTITPNDDNIGVEGVLNLGAFGGGGLAGGGRGGVILSITDEIILTGDFPLPPGSSAFLAAGGGSGFLASGLTALSTGPNVGAGFITITWFEAAATAGSGTGLAATGVGVEALWLPTLLFLSGVILACAAAMPRHRTDSPRHAVTLRLGPLSRRAARIR